MEKAGAVCPGVLVLTAGLSKPFRRLSKYPAMLQELARHVHEAHPDRGDTFRAAIVYKDISNGCSDLRRQKELELQVVTGEVRGWPNGELSALGEVLHMGSVAVGPSNQDRYLVLFPSALLLLSVSKRVSAFVYEGCLPLNGITVCKLEDTGTCKNAFEISGSMMDTIIALCQTKAEADNWVSLLQQHSNTGSPLNELGQPFLYLIHSPSEDALSSINSRRRSLCHVTLPPPGYPSASPYNSLTKYLARLVKNKVITRQMLRSVLHERTLDEALGLIGQPVMRRHKNRFRLRIQNESTIFTHTDISDSESEGKSESTMPYATSNCNCADCYFLTTTFSMIQRQDAVENNSPRTSDSCSMWGGYLECGDYCDNAADLNADGSEPINRIECSMPLFKSIHLSENSYNVLTPANTDDIEVDFVNKGNNIRLPSQQHTESTKTLSFEAHRLLLACEDLVNLDQNIQIPETYFSNELIYFVPTRRSFPNLSQNNNMVQRLFWKSTKKCFSLEEKENIFSINLNLFKSLISPQLPKPDAYSPEESIIIDPPTMFRSEDHDISINLNTEISFRKHSINSADRIGQCLPRLLIENDFNRNGNRRLRRMTLHSEKIGSKCNCCNKSICQTPRSSDSGVVDSCNLASPDLQMHTEYENGTWEKTSSLGDSFANLHHDNFDGHLRNKLDLSVIEATTFKEQCRCTSSFASTARTSYVTSVTSENSLDAIDSATNNVICTLTTHPLLLSPQIKRKSIRRTIESHVPEMKLKPVLPSHDCKKSFMYLKFPRNVRLPLPGHRSMLNDTKRLKPSLHYHMRIYRENPNDKNTDRQFRKNVPRNCELFDETFTEQGKACRKSSVPSEYRPKLQKCLSKTQKGMVYRSDLYAHWWMKAKLPDIVVNDSGKDYFCKCCLCAMI